MRSTDIPESPFTDPRSGGQIFQGYSPGSRQVFGPPEVDGWVVVLEKQILSVVGREFSDFALVELAGFFSDVGDATNNHGASAQEPLRCSACRHWGLGRWTWPPGG